jgi:hypothetical protein
MQWMEVRVQVRYQMSVPPQMEETKDQNRDRELKYWGVQLMPVIVMNSIDETEKANQRRRNEAALILVSKG